MLERHIHVLTDELGECKKVKVLLLLELRSTFVFKSRCLVFYPVLPIFEQVSERLQRSGITEPVNFSDWTAPILIIRKPNRSIRQCVVYSTGLNKSLEADHYSLTLSEDLYGKLNE